jgi:hypothetical protein
MKQIASAGIHPAQMLPIGRAAESLAPTWKLPSHAAMTSVLGVTVVLAWCLSINDGFGKTVLHVGSYSNWTTTWQPLASGNDDNNAGVNDTLDFVGDIINPGLYWAENYDYVFFRMRVDAETFTTASGAHILLIDIEGQGVTGIDYGFAWDSKSNDNTRHGLEMSIAAVNGPTWGLSQLDDMDGSNGQKLVNDINGVGRVSDGYVRSIDAQSTTNFGNTTYIDFAVSWTYMNTYTNLRKGQNWKIGVAGITNATDHNTFNADVGGGANLADSISVGWSSTASIPEPNTTVFIGLAGMFVFRRRRVTANH